MNLAGLVALVFTPDVETMSDFNVGRAANGFILGAEWKKFFLNLAGKVILIII